MTADADIEALVRRLALEAKRASLALATTPTQTKNAVLLRAAASLRGPAGDAVIEANGRDLVVARELGLDDAMLDRLRLDRARVDGVAEGVEHVASLPDPVGEQVDQRRLPNGLEVARMRVPLGLIGIIYESRPNVTADAAALCIKSGNAVLLRGGKEAFHSNRAIAAVFGDAHEAEELPRAAVTLIPTTDHAATLAMIRLDGVVDLVIPRGGEGLIHFVADNARVPVVRHYKGVCHVYVDGDADLEMALAIAINAKTQRPGVCNAMETLLVDEACADAFVPKALRALAGKRVEVHADDGVRARAGELAARVVPLEPEDWDREYLRLAMNFGVVDGIDGALAHVGRHGSNHTEAIVTEDPDKADRWLREVDASLVLVNASTRFNDGAQLGLGAEMGISTTKLHAYGPMGLSELCTLKWIGRGAGQVRA